MNKAKRAKNNESTGLITKPRYWGNEGHDLIFEGDILQFDDKKKCVIVRWVSNIGAWCFFDPREPKFKGLLYKIVSAVNVIGHRDFSKELLKDYNDGKDIESVSYGNWNKVFEMCLFRNKHEHMNKYNKSLKEN